MSDEKSQSPTGHGEPASSEPISSDSTPGADTEIPVGDMTGEGQTDIGPHPSLTHIENLEQADLPAAAAQIAEAKPEDE
jgi:hypothetical protein